MSLSELSKFNIDLDKGEALLTEVSARRVWHLALLLKAPERSKKLPQWLNVSYRTLNYYRAGERSPTLVKAVEMFDTLGYDLIVRKRDDQ